MQFVTKMTSVFMIGNIDLTYVFLKTFQKQIKKIEDHKALQDLCEFVHSSVIVRIVDLDPQPTPNVNSKLLEVGLKVLHSSWKALIQYKWPDHQKFTTNLIE